MISCILNTFLYIQCNETMKCLNVPYHLILIFGSLTVKYVLLLRNDISKCIMAIKIRYSIEVMVNEILTAFPSLPYSKLRRFIAWIVNNLYQLLIHVSFGLMVSVFTSKGSRPWVRFQPDQTKDYKIEAIQLWFLNYLYQFLLHIPVHF